MAGASVPRHAQDGRGSNHEKPSQIAVTHLADAGLTPLSIAAIGSGRQPQPRCELPARAEQVGIGTARGHGTGSDRADCRKGGEPAARLIGAMPVQGAALHRFDLFTESLKLPIQATKRRLRQLR